mmetsp:Transcript_65717/g.154643  ORF Transcript_65717/g.154643 Transcript_65717/m.154643 type:complete len:233 (-) Transcript_65717:33-731(-)
MVDARSFFPKELWGLLQLLQLLQGILCTLAMRRRGCAQVPRHLCNLLAMHLPDSFPTVLPWLGWQPQHLKLASMRRAERLSTLRWLLQTRPWLATCRGQRATRRLLHNPLTVRRLACASSTLGRYQELHQHQPQGHGALPPGPPMLFVCSWARPTSPQEQSWPRASRQPRLKDMKTELPVGSRTCSPQVYFCKHPRTCRAQKTLSLRRAERIAFGNFGTQSLGTCKRHAAMS